MEAAGLGIGVAGLVGLFNTCVDIIERVDSYKDVGGESRGESRSLLARFEADRVRLRQWGQIVGLDKHQPDDHDNYQHYKALEDPAVRIAVRQILQSIKDIEGGREIDGGIPGGTEVNILELSDSDVFSRAQSKGRLHLEEF